MSRPACVNVTAGIVTLEVTDFSFPGFIPFTFVRSYRSNSAADGLLGPCWALSAAEDLTPDGAELVLRNAEGRAVRLPRPQPGAEPVTNRVEGIALTAELYQTPNGMTTVFAIRSGPRIRRYARVDNSPRYRLLRIDDLHGNGLRFMYSGGQLTEIEDTLQRRFLLTHDHGGRLTGVHLDGPGGPLPIVNYGYDAHGMLVLVTKRSGAVNHYQYQDRLLVLHTDDQGVRYSNLYDHRRRCIRSWRGSGFFHREYHYDDSRHQTLVVNSLGVATLYRYNEFNLVTETVDALGGISRFHYDEGNSVILAANQLDHATLIGYDTGKRPVALTRADGSAESYRYDDAGRPIEHTDAAGGVSTAEYNDWDDLVASTTAGGITTRYEYDHRGATIGITFGNGQRLVRENGPDFIRFLHDGRVLIERRYDQFGQPVLVDFRGRYQLTLQYDERGQLSQVMGVGGGIRRFSWDAGGRLRAVTDERDITTAYEYNEIGLRTATERAGQRTEFAYDTEGHLIAVRNSRGEVHRTTFDVLGRMVRQQFFDGRTEDYRHDAAGGITSIRDSSGREISYELDPAGRPVVERHSDGTVCEFAYAPGGALARAVRNGYIVEFEYDADGRVLLQRQDDFELHYEYNEVGRLSRLGDSTGKILELDRDPLMRMRTARITIPGDGPEAGAVHRLAFQYDDLNALTAIELAGGPRLERQVNGWRKPVWQRASVAAQPLLEERFSYDQGGALVARQWHGGPVLGYAYDAAGSLASVSEAGRVTEAYAYDSEFNLTEKHSANGTQIHHTILQYGPGNRLARVGEREYAYDEAGLLSVVNDAGRQTRCRYSVDDLLLRVEAPDGTVTEFQYDALRRRVAKTTAGRLTRFYWDRQTLWAEQQLVPDEPDHSWQLARSIEYLFDPASWALLATVVGGRCQLVVNDALGAPHTVLDADGAIVWQLRTTAWGEVIGGALAPDAHMPIRFPGQYADAETGLHYNLNRYYEPGTGRYTSPDPIGLRGGVNCYSYTADPVNFSDPLGLECQNFKQGEPSTLYRGDSRPPSDICGKGFSPRNPAANISIADHVGGKCRGWVSTSYDYDTAARFGKESNDPRYVYVIANPACAANPGHEVDCDPGVQKRQEDLKAMGVSPEESEFEIAFKNVPGSAVVGFVPIAPDGTPGDFTTC